MGARRPWSAKAEFVRRDQRGASGNRTTGLDAISGQNPSKMSPEEPRPSSHNQIVGAPLVGARRPRPVSETSSARSLVQEPTEQTSQVAPALVFHSCSILFRLGTVCAPFVFRYAPEEPPSQLRNGTKWNIVEHEKRDEKDFAPLRGLQGHPFGLVRGRGGPCDSANSCHSSQVPLEGYVLPVSRSSDAWESDPCVPALPSDSRSWTVTRAPGRCFA